MAKTRGVGYQGHGCTRLTTSVCKRDWDHAEEMIGVDVRDEQQQGFPNAHDEQVEHAEGFPKGSSDLSFLVNFVDHVVAMLWEGEVRTKKPSIKLSWLIVV